MTTNVNPSQFLHEINMRLVQNRLTWMEVRYILIKAGEIPPRVTVLGHLDYTIRHRLADSDATWKSLVEIARKMRLNGTMPEGAIRLHYQLYPDDLEKDLEKDQEKDQKK